VVVQAAPRGGQHLAGLAVPASAVAIQASARIGEPPAAALQEMPIPLDALIEIQEALPYPSVALAHADAAATTRIRRELPPRTEPGTIATWADQAGIMLSQIGRPADALSAEQEAVAIRRELAAANPGAHRPELATSLNILAITLSELGRNGEAAAARNEADRLRSA
jgi:hypothetical protein